MCTTKACVECKRVLPNDSDHFYRSVHFADGYHNKCRDCSLVEFKIKEARYEAQLALAAHRGTPLEGYYQRKSKQEEAAKRKDKKVAMYAADEKVCSCCGEIKPLSAFHKNSKTLSGRNSQCKDCVKEAGIRSRLKKAEGNTERIDNDCEEREQERKAS